MMDEIQKAGPGYLIPGFFFNNTSAFIISIYFVRLAVSYRFSGIMCGNTGRFLVAMTKAGNIINI
jgi:hypothetical protein